MNYRAYQYFLFQYEDNTTCTHVEFLVQNMTCICHFCQNATNNSYSTATMHSR